MKKNYKNISIGFTLIEMMVVALIIGILTAILIPYYQHAVAQSRFSTLMPIAKNIAAAQEAYYMQRGRYATSLSALDTGVIGSDGKVALAFSEEDDFKFAMLNHVDVPHAYYVIYFKNSKNFPNNIHCEARNDNETAMWLCEDGLDGEKIEHGSLKGNGYTTFILQGNADDGHYTKLYYNTSDVVLLSGDSCVASGGAGCNNMDVSGESTCVAEQGGSGCDNSTFDNSTCEAQEGSSASCQNGVFTNNSVCSAHSSSSCSGSEFSASSCYAAGGNNTCGAGSTFTNGSVCYGETSATSRAGTSCGNSTYIDSTCRADAAQGFVCGASTYNNSVCYSGRNGGCGGGSTYSNDSICYGNGKNTCDKSTFTSGSVCHALQTGACSGLGNEPNTFDGASCYGNAENSCSTAVFKNSSVCYANKKGACVGKNGNSSYQSGSYCTGNYCPVGSPKQGGGTWQSCPDAGNSGKTC